MGSETYGVLRHLNMPYDLSYIKSRYTRLELWLERAVELREQVMMSAGLMPMPEKTALNARIFGRVEREGYSVEKVCFQSLPGFYVAGNLYRPLGGGPRPAILNPHGHWKEGRLEDSETCSVPGRCINFARQGFVAFSYDMVDYVDSRQWEHRRLDLRDSLWGLSTGGLQLWNSIRALDFVQSLPDVDPNKIACTGASGGGTQTFLLCAVDGRVKVAAPVNMISAHMQGGCVCENPPGLRVDTDNIEISALMAPSPMLMVSATGDWTKDTVEVEYPAVRHIYELFGAEDKLACVRVDAGHNYDKDSREAVYSFFDKWLHPAPKPGTVAEQPFEVEPDLRVFPGGMPEGALDVDGLVAQWIQSSDRQLERIGGSPEQFAEVYRTALTRALALPARMEVAAEIISDDTDVDVSAKRVFIEERLRGARIPAVIVEATDSIADKAVVVVDGPDGIPFMECGPVRALAENGWRVVGVGPAILPEDSPPRRPDVNFLDVYNRTDTQERVYEIAAACKWASQGASRVALVGTGLGAGWCVLAAPFAESVTDLAVDCLPMDVTDDALVRDFYAPGLRRAGDFRAANKLIAARTLPGYSAPSEAADWLCENRAR